MGGKVDVSISRESTALCVCRPVWAWREEGGPGGDLGLGKDWLWDVRDRRVLRTCPATQPTCSSFLQVSPRSLELTPPLQGQHVPAPAPKPSRL